MEVARIHFKGFKATGNCQRKVCHMRVIQEINRMLPFKKIRPEA